MLIARVALAGASVMFVACSSEAAPEPDPGEARAEHPAELPARAERPPLQPNEDLPMRVLVTGFNDWRELGDPPNLWRCRDNPSCRLLLGPAQDARPNAYAGPLVARLEAGAPGIEWRFSTMPVTWGAFADVPDDVDVIINVGLGVYDRFDVLQLEVGAYNLRKGADAAAAEDPGPIDDAVATVLEAPATSPIASHIASVVGQRMAGYEVVVADARPDNSYLCNETHFHALSAVARGDGRLREAYFLHIPYAKDDDYETLAEGVAGVVLALTKDQP